MPRPDHPDAPDPEAEAPATPAATEAPPRPATPPIPAPGGPGASRPPAGPVPLVGARAFLRLDRADLAWLGLLVAAAFVIRALGPIFPDVLSSPLSSAPISAWGIGTPYNPGGCNQVPVDGTGDELPETTRAPDGGTIKTPDEKHCGFVFDEVYFPVDAAIDLHQPPHDYFDPEPPLTKLIMAPAIDLLGFGPVSWRITTAICGSLLVGVVYLIARRLRGERFFAIAAATAVALDGLAIVESRVGVIDIIAILWSALAVYAFLLHWSARTHRQWRATLYAFAAVLGLAFGAKLTAVTPAILAAALIATRLLEPTVLRWLRRSPGELAPASGEAQMWRDAAGPNLVLHVIGAVAVVAVLFVGTYARYLTIPHTLVNFATCTQDGGLTTDSAQPSTLYTNPDWNQPGNVVERAAWFAGDALRDVRAQVAVSLTYHSVECRDHPYASRWYTWPVQAHPVLMSVATTPPDASGAPTTGYITNLGSPAVWWLSIPALLFCLVAMTRGPSPTARLAPLALLAVSLALAIGAFHAAEQPPAAKDVHVSPSPLFLLGILGMVGVGAVCLWCAVARRRFVPAFIVMGYGAAWMMWTLGNEKRVLFSYHMLGALPFAALGLAYALTALRVAIVRVGGVEIPLRPLAWAGLGVVAAAFVFFEPIWTGAPLTVENFALRTWFSAWIDGWQS